MGYFGGMQGAIVQKNLRLVATGKTTKFEYHAQKKGAMVVPIGASKGVADIGMPFSSRGFCCEDGKGKRPPPWEILAFRWSW